MSKILLSTLNARYIHASLGLRYLLANMQELQASTELIEFTIDKRPIDICEELLAKDPEIIGFGVYIWNVNETKALISLIKALKPACKIILGGPEISYEPDPKLVELSDYIISGQADHAFYNLCKQILSKRAPLEKLITAKTPSLDSLVAPYELYSDEDIAHRVLYVEASRGCPFKCEFCLSALDKTAWPFDLDKFLADMQVLYERGARHFKFVDRTFNLKIPSTLKILDFFLAKLAQSESLFLHFEIIPDHLPDALKEKLALFPPGVLQFEVGIQSFNEDVQKNISRRQKNAKSKENIAWLRQNTHAHIHTDLIFGLPGETLESFADSFDELIHLNPHEIQVGILKRLKGTNIIRHTDEYEMVFNPEPPFNILSNRDVDFATMQRINRFARYWDIFGNSGRFNKSLPLLLGDAPFERFLIFSDWLFESAKQTHKISLLRQFDFVADALRQCFNYNNEQVHDALAADYSLSGLKSVPKCLNQGDPHASTGSKRKFKPARQARHLMSENNQETKQ